MAIVIPRAPFRRLENATSIWGVYEQLSDYDNWTSSRGGEYIENLFAFSRITNSAHTDAIYAYAGTEAADAGIHYEWQSHANVATSLNSVPKYKDFYDIVALLGYESDDVVVTTAVNQLQEMVNESRQAAGLPIHSEENGE